MEVWRRSWSEGRKACRVAIMAPGSYALFRDRTAVQAGRARGSTCTGTRDGIANAWFRQLLRDPLLGLNGGCITHGRVGLDGLNDYADVETSMPEIPPVHQRQTTCGFIYTTKRATEGWERKGEGNGCEAKPNP